MRCRHLIQEVYKTLAGVGKEPVVPERPQPAVPVKKSVFPDHIICLEDGKKLKMLKRHLKTAYNMTPEQYRERWGLPADYPMVAPNYARHRSSLAKKIGLGTKPRAAGAPEPRRDLLSARYPRARRRRFAGRRWTEPAGFGYAVSVAGPDRSGVRRRVEVRLRRPDGC